MNHLMIECDKQGNIRTIMLNQDKINIQVGECLINIIEKESHASFFTLLQEVNQFRFALGHDLNLVFNNKIKLYTFSAYYDQEDRLIILALDQESQKNLVLSEIMKINNEQLNQLRKIHKEKIFNIEKEHAEIYQEFSRLNNELLNSKRIITKQNLELEESNKKLKLLAMTDQLTGVYNRWYFHQFISSKLQECVKEETVLLTLIDFNNLKLVNDNKGHLAGDNALKLFVALTKDILDDNYWMFRLGGDEFAIITIKKTYKELTELLDKINVTYQNQLEISSLAYGIIDITTDVKVLPSNVEEYLKQADQKMYKHKSKVKSIS